MPLESAQYNILLIIFSTPILLASDWSTFGAGLFEDIPNSLYFTAVFLGGEWGVIDYSVPNKILCIFFCVVGIALFSIPTGTLFEASASGAPFPSTTC